MKFLLCIMVLIGAQCGNAATRYSMNDSDISFKRCESTHLSLVKEHREGDDTVAVRMHNNNIDAKSYPGTFVSVNPADEDVFGRITGWAFLTIDGVQYPLDSFQTRKLTLQGNKFEFNAAVFCGVKSITFEALEGSPSMFTKISFHRDSVGKIALHGRLDFTTLFECMQNVGDSSLAMGIGQPDLNRHFLISGAEMANCSIRPASVSRSPGKAAGKSTGKASGKQKYASEMKVGYSSRKQGHR
ncbi:MAG: hypothetical protein K2W94_04080 [Alphaproteobacteria bacterium]|nr:hypothetical protein [Alphaproteobacteria bacterium]